MKTYKELQAEIRNLQSQAEKARQLEIDGAIAEIKAKIEEFGITAADLFGSAGRKSSRKGSVVQPKYRNTATGETWSGRGKPPRWIAGKDRNQYLIKSN